MLERPPELTDARVRFIIAALAAGATPGDLARALGIDTATLAW